ncbi:HTTM domain-containing protein [Lewinella sp. 4G2]|uniref:HTTM domain-containing protein n=1 Tax=Lewinella sp. 4G2 TaxID=1803372 RepID=UPI0007B46985|nr:HTTM domain-containing protein [Lewinella sp. 4G2]OAV45037.1 deoxyribonuclease HsdR [Lewinella sp. 4G2]
MALFDNRPVSGAPLALFRITFGTMMVLSVIRFWANGWIEKLYLEPTYFFKYDYFEWVRPLGEGTYALFAVVGLSALAIALGWKYRLATITFFLSFTYVELMDKTTYLNHYYFVSLLALAMIFLPAGKSYSLDAGWRDLKVPTWTIQSLKLFVAVVYFYAGLAKLNSDWLLHAQPLAIWLPGKYSIPLLGGLLQERWVQFAFAWGGAAYDLLIPFLLLWKPTRKLAFVAVVIFHVLTRVLFPIGMFPYIMIVSALIFFEPTIHQRILAWIGRFLPVGQDSEFKSSPSMEVDADRKPALPFAKIAVIALLAFHLIFPWRYLLHDGELFWTEEGYRFSWRVMLMEKAGYVSYRLVNPETGRSRTVEPSQYLTTFQNKQLATQPDFLLEFAHFLAEREAKRTGTVPQVYVDSFVALNGRRSQPYLRSDIDLVTISPTTPRTEWLMPFKDTIYGL